MSNKTTTTESYLHKSDCAVHNEPATPNGPCDCQERNCAFQYATQRGEIICDETELTLDEAKALWNTHYPDAAKRIESGQTIQMAIWHNMPDVCSYGEKFAFIDNDAKSDGKTIWEGSPRIIKTY